MSLNESAWILWMPAFLKKTLCRFSRPERLKISDCNAGILFPDRSSTCMSGSSEAGSEVRPASGHKADFFPDVHLQRHTAGQSVQSGNAAAFESRASVPSRKKRASRMRPRRGWCLVPIMPLSVSLSLLLVDPPFVD